MDHYKMEEGDLELLALGLLEEERANHLLLMIQNDPKLSAEFDEVQQALQQVAEDNALPVPDRLFEQLQGDLFNKERVVEESVFEQPAKVHFFDTLLFRAAASVALLLSLLFNIYQWNKEKGFKAELDKTTIEKSFYASLPMSGEDMEALSKTLAIDLQKEPCQGNFEHTRAFLVEKGYDDDMVTAYFFDHNGHCDCEILHNMKAHPPQPVFHHGDIPLTAALEHIPDSQHMFASLAFVQTLARLR
ncbi:DUF2695 domain-containing protein [Marinilongibacter aquaticus]|uniref:DUF2695 domain-containing protein n=1 Tax=Marinilongibacter aquaticus TaxID=2975157 RepID=UPI0021BD022B|nr:DUF2695 domain-containing protein [Marinilongibacter aquaticus]UBM59768.1 DUF2695 domain-containing protein [Marinilongibacter aquaticus]